MSTAYIQALEAAAPQIEAGAPVYLVEALHREQASPSRAGVRTLLLEWAAVSARGRTDAEPPLNKPRHTMDTDAAHGTGCRGGRARYREAAGWIRGYGSQTLRARLDAHEATVERRRPKSEGGDGSLKVCVVARRRRDIVAGAEAEGFGAPPAGGTDVVYTLGASGGKFGDDWELRHSIRSWFAHFADLGRIWIVGARPEWLRASDRIRHVQMGDPIARCKDANLIRKLLRVCDEPDLTERFLFCSDDQLLLQDMTAADFRAYYRFDLAGRDGYLAGGGKWRKRLARTAEWLLGRGLPALHYEAHVPMPFSSTDYPAIMAAVPGWDTAPGFTVNTIYFNQRAGIEPVRKPRMLKLTLEKRSMADAADRVRSGHWRLLGYNNAGLTPEVRAAIEELLPIPSEAEGEPVAVPPARAVASVSPPPRPTPAPWPGEHEPRNRREALRVVRGLARPLVVGRDDYGSAALVIEPGDRAAHRCRTRLARGCHDALVIDTADCGWAEALAADAGLPLYDLNGICDPTPAPGLSVLIPIHRLEDSPERLLAFRHVLKSLQSAIAPMEILVCEQTEPGGRGTGKYNRTGVRHVKFECAGNLNRAALRNAAALAATGSVLLFLDADVLLDWAAVTVAAVALREGKVVKPFNRVLRLDPADTARVYAGETIASDASRGSVSVLGGGALLIHAADFAAVRGYDESFGSLWGYEDEDLGRRLGQYDVEELECAALHCWHPLVDRREGKRNKALFRRLCGLTPLEAVARVESEFRRGSEGQPRGSRRRRDVALLLIAYGDSPARVEATRRALDITRWLDPVPEVFFLEILDEGQERTRYIPEWMWGSEWCHCETLTMREENTGAWQKEAGLNRLAGRAMSAGCTKIVTLDPDSRPGRLDWIQSIADHLDARHGCALQPWRSICDTEDETRENTPSYAYARACGQDPIARGPGLAWAMTVETWRALGGLNPFFAPGGGDTGLAMRLDPDGPISHVPRQWAWWNEVLLFQPTHPLEIDFLDADMIHENHGTFASRAYTGRNVAIDRLGVSVLRNMWLDERGLVAIARTPEGEAIRHVLLNRGRLETELNEVVNEAMKILEGVRKRA